ncbi:hypothetical protein BURCENBC7_AP4240 [Burkholderia cenocepacia BC7]|nr:hypothetical protein BURCENK562V_C5155 [Burkholderia cenocepacia K56-2Valvano]ERI24755.1 hypothetical protein BURCENBC7_AP4240 [Burkholderia cenocepacia BC7]
MPTKAADRDRHLWSNIAHNRPMTAFIPNIYKIQEYNM